jgi:hypothetical protein
MSRTRLLLLTSMATLATVAMPAATASAKISFEWFVGGSLLKEKETRAFTVRSDGKLLDLHSKFLGINWLLLSSEVSVGSGAQIIGGRPGTNLETVVFKGVTVDPPLQKCVAETGGITKPVAGTIETRPLKTEIVEGENGEVLILFTPEGGGNFTEILFLNKGIEECAANNALFSLTGSFLALPLPQKAEVLRQDLDFEAAEKTYFNSAGTLGTGGIKAGTEPFTLTGLTLIVLASNAVFGAF